MLNINMEYKKGALFVRLDGYLDKTSHLKIDHDLKDMIVKYGIKYLVFNIENLILIDHTGIESLIESFNVISKNNGKIIICGINDDMKKVINQTNLLKYLRETSDEVGALQLIGL